MNPNPCSCGRLLSLTPSFKLGGLYAGPIRTASPGYFTKVRNFGYKWRLTFEGPIRGGRIVIFFIHERPFAASDGTKRHFLYSFEHTFSKEYFTRQFLWGCIGLIVQPLEAAAFIRRSWQSLKSSFSG